MPELPEVESIKRFVSPVFIGQKLIKYSINDKRTNRFNTINPKNLGFLLDVARKGKILDLTFKDYSILFHLGMSGRIDISNKRNKHTRALFKFNKDCLVFDDIRKFGYIKILKNDEFSAILTYTYIQKKQHFFFLTLFSFYPLLLYEK